MLLPNTKTYIEFKNLLQGGQEGGLLLIEED